MKAPLGPRFASRRQAQIWIVAIAAMLSMRAVRHRDAPTSLGCVAKVEPKEHVYERFTEEDVRDDLTEDGRGDLTGDGVVDCWLKTPDFGSGGRTIYLIVRPGCGAVSWHVEFQESKWDVQHGVSVPRAAGAAAAVPLARLFFEEGDQVPIDRPDAWNTTVDTQHVFRLELLDAPAGELPRVTGSGPPASTATVVTIESLASGDDSAILWVSHGGFDEPRVRAACPDGATVWQSWDLLAYASTDGVWWWIYAEEQGDEDQSMPRNVVCLGRGVVVVHEESMFDRPRTIAIDVDRRRYREFPEGLLVRPDHDPAFISIIEDHQETRSSRSSSAPEPARRR